MTKSEIEIQAAANEILGMVTRYKDGEISENKLEAVLELINNRARAIKYILE